MGDGEAALKYYLVAYDQFHELHKANESNENFLENLTIAIAKLGSLYFEFGNTDEALKHFQEFNELSYILYQINPHNETIVSLHAGRMKNLETFISLWVSKKMPFLVLRLPILCVKMPIP